MKVVLIRPSMFGERASDALEPLVLTLLAALTPPEVELVCYDERIEPVPERLKADLVAMTVETFTARRAYQLAEGYRVQGIPVVMGGFHPSMEPEECLAYADAVVVGDCEDTWPQLLADARRGRMASRYHSGNKTRLDQLGYDRSILAGKKYNPIGIVQYGRGCRYQCDFCSIHAFYGTSLRQRQIDQVVTEMGSMKQRVIFLADDNLLISREQAMDLCRAFIPLKKKWVCQISLDVALDDELLALMKSSGCMMVIIGFETLNPENLKQMGKGANLKHHTYEAQIENIYRHGIMIYGSFVLGYDQDTPETFDETVAFAIKNKLAIANFNPLMPMPGTALYQRLKAENRLLHDRWWLDPAYRYGDAMFQPLQMTPEELTEGCKRARFQFSSWASMGKRLLGASPNHGGLIHLGIYLAANWISGKEIHHKQGRQLGGMDDENHINQTQYRTDGA